MPLKKCRKILDVWFEFHNGYPRETLKNYLGPLWKHILIPVANFATTGLYVYYILIETTTFSEWEKLCLVNMEPYSVSLGFSNPGSRELSLWSWNPKVIKRAFWLTSCHVSMEHVFSFCWGRKTNVIHNFGSCTKYFDIHWCGGIITVG